ncbi:MAG: HPr kinase/phosphorylase [Ignavibacteria bacterium]|nr:HPr kinase/phosphorylase [Ignavibacteria bacterium]
MIKIDSRNTKRKENISVEFFFETARDKFKLKSYTGEIGFEKLICDQNIHRPGLALAGFVDLFTYNRVQIVGNTELRYLQQLDSTQRRQVFERLLQFDIPCIIVTDGNTPPEEMVSIAQNQGIAVFGSEYSTTKLSYFVGDFLDDQFAPRVSIHGSFVDVYGVGMLFIGKSGIGKSEVALDLVERGHRLVADDVVILTKKGENVLIGSGTKLVKHFMEVRGIGIVDVKSMFGVRSIRFQKRLEIIIELELWDNTATYTRTGLDNKTIDILDIELPYVKLPILPGKNVTVISEVIALNYLLKHFGYDTAKEFENKLKESIRKKTEEKDNRTINYFEHDFE